VTADDFVLESVDSHAGPAACDRFVANVHDMVLREDRVQELLTRAHREIDAGLLPSCQLALAIDGEGPGVRDPLRVRVNRSDRQDALCASAHLGPR
jgi:hypothetical protein